MNQVTIDRIKADLAAPVALHAEQPLAITREAILAVVEADQVRDMMRTLASLESAHPGPEDRS